MSSPLTVFRFSWWHFSEAVIGQSAIANQLSYNSGRDEPSLVMNDINSLTHSCMHSFASFAIFAFSGRAVFIILATGAKFLMLASEYSCFPALEARGASGEDDEEAWDMIECVTIVVQQDINRLRSELNDWL